MTIVKTNETQGTITVPGTSYSYSHTTAAGANRFLLVLASMLTAFGSPSVTYNSIALTQLTLYTPGGMKMGAFYLKNPPVGTYSLALSWTSNGWGGSTALSYTGVDLADPIAQWSQSFANTTAKSATLNNVSPTSVLVDSLCVDQDLIGSFAADVGQTELDKRNIEQDGGGNAFYVGISTEPGPNPLGDSTLGWSWTTTSDAGQILCELKAKNVGLLNNLMRKRRIF